MVVKTCFKCGKLKNIDEFYTHNQMKDGHLNKCISCTKKDVKEKGSIYDKTEKGVIRIIYKTQKRNSKIRNMPPPNYNKEELKVWLYKNNFKELYDKWVLSGYNKYYKPSVDRIDSLIGYNLDNIRLVTWKENFEYSINDTFNAVGSNGKRCKSVALFDKHSNIICKFLSISSASRSFGYNVHSKIKNNIKNKDGSYWYYLN